MNVTILVRCIWLGFILTWTLIANLPETNGDANASVIRPDCGYDSDCGTCPKDPNTGIEYESCCAGLVYDVYSTETLEPGNCECCTGKCFHTPSRNVSSNVIVTCTDKEE